MTTVPNIAPIGSGVANTYTAVSTFNITVPATTSGSGLFLSISNELSASTTFVSSITGGGTWSQVAVVASGLTALELWYCPGATAAATTVTVNLASSLTGRYCYAEFSGLIASGAFDVSATGSASAQPWSVTNTTAAVANQVELVIETDLTANVGKGGNSATPSGYTKLIGNGATPSNQLEFNYKIRVKATGTETSTLTGSSASSTPNITSILATFQSVANVIQQTHTVATIGTTTTVTVPFAGTTGVIAVDNTSGGASTVTQTGNTWTKIDSSTGTNAAVELWYAKNMSGTSGTTITFGNSVASAYTEIYGLSATAPLDQHVKAAAACGASTTTNAVTGTTGTTSNNPQIALAAVGMVINAKSGTWSLPLNGYVSLANTTSGGNSINLLMNILTSNTTTSTGATLTTTLSTNSYGTVLATFSETAINSVINKNNMLLLGAG